MNNKLMLLTLLMYLSIMSLKVVCMENNALTRLTKDEGELFFNDVGIFVH